MRVCNPKLSGRGQKRESWTIKLIEVNAYDVIFELVGLSRPFFQFFFDKSVPSQTHQCNDAGENMLQTLCVCVYGRADGRGIDVDGSKATSFTCTRAATCMSFRVQIMCVAAVCAIVSHPPLSIRLLDNNNFKPRCKRALTELINNIVYVERCVCVCECIYPRRMKRRAQCTQRTTKHEQ